MRKLAPLLLLKAIVLVALLPIFSLDPSRIVIAQNSIPDPANEQACPSQPGAGGGAEAIPAFVGLRTLSRGFQQTRMVTL